MATYNEIKIESLNLTDNLSSLDCCDICGSDNIAETHEGFTCRDCGVVLEVQKFEYHKPYSDDIVQHAIIGKTQIGSKRERLQMKNSVHIEQLSKLDSLRSSEENVKVMARIEIRRILTGLEFPLTDIDALLDQFSTIRSKLGRGTKYRSAHKLVPAIIYFYYKNQGKPIHEDELLEIAHISKKDFYAFKIPMLSFWPEYQERNRKEYISRKILEVSEHYNLGMAFYYQSKKILSRFYEGIKNTKDSVIVGLVTSITLLCSGRKDIKISNFCDLLNIRMSTIQSQIYKRIFERFQVPGFESLVKSADLLKCIMNKLGLLDAAIMELEDSEQRQSETPEIIHVVLGSASPIHNFHSNQLIVKESAGYMRFSITQNDLNQFSYNENVHTHRKVEKVSKPKTNIVELWHYHYPTKGPPIGVT